VNHRDAELERSDRACDRGGRGRSHGACTERGRDRGDVDVRRCQPVTFECVRRCRVGDGEPAEDLAAAVIDDEDRERRDGSTCGEQAAEIVREGNIAEHEQHGARASRTGGRRDQAIDSRRTTLRDHRTVAARVLAAAPRCAHRVACAGVLVPRKAVAKLELCYRRGAPIAARSGTSLSA
jgi:hypothetical protein